MTNTIKKLDKAMNNLWRYLLNEDDEKAILAALKFSKAMMPKPIEECPNGVSVLVFRDDDTIEMIDAEDNDYTWVKYDGKDWNPCISKPTHFTPLPDQTLKELEEALK